jgi:hypothetical protein
MGKNLTTFDLLILASLDRLLLIFQTLFTFVTKQAILMRRSTVLSLSLQLVFSGLPLVGGYILTENATF